MNSELLVLVRLPQLRQIALLLLLLLCVQSEGRSFGTNTIISKGGGSARAAAHSSQENEGLSSLAEVASWFQVGDRIEGDIRLPESFYRSRNAVNDLSKRWTKAVVPYNLADNFAAEVQAEIAAAFAELEQSTCLTFVAYDSSAHQDYLTIENFNECASGIGREGGQQYLTLGPSCLKKGEILHELMHTLGFWHEHSREDRNQFIDIDFENVITTEQRNFAKYPTAVATLLGEAYDYASIMHYGAYAYAIDPSKPTINTLDPSAMNVIGQRVGLSGLDIRKINTYYECP